jgi:phosphohistidine phosphatase
MGKQLYLVRHADAEEQGAGQKDFDRELTHLGLLKASRAGQWLADQGASPQALFASPAKRAAYTAELIHERTGQLANLGIEENLYNASPRTLLDFIAKLDDEFDVVLLVGHNPGISYVAEYLTGQAAVSAMSPGGIAHLQLDLDHWQQVGQHTAKLAFYHVPETH